MLRFLRTLFGSSESEIDPHRAAMKADSWLVDRGAEIADDCLVNGLRRGEVVKLREVELVIRANEERPAPVVNGFLKRTKEFVDPGEIRAITFANDEIALVHKDHVPEFLERLDSETVATSRRTRPKRSG